MNIDKNQTRQEKILDLLSKKGFRSVAWFSKYFAVSEMTIRRDLQEFERRGLIQRTHGGAFPSRRSIVELDFSIRQNLNLPQKKAIGKYASELIEPVQY